MSNRMKKKSGALKYFILIILLAILVIVFYMSRDNTEKINNSSNTPSNSSSSGQPSSPSGEPSTPQVTPGKDDGGSGTISGGGDIVTADSYALYDTYVIASEKTTYSNSGYKYFIVRSYTEYEKYIEQNLKSPFESSYISQYTQTNSETLSSIKQIIDKDFFKKNCLIFIVDYSTKEIGAQIVNMQTSENTVTLNIDRTADTNNKSKYTTYIVPIEQSDIKSVSISYIR